MLDNTPPLGLPRVSLCAVFTDPSGLCREPTLRPAARRPTELVEVGDLLGLPDGEGTLDRSAAGMANGFLWIWLDDPREADRQRCVELARKLGGSVEFRWGLRHPAVRLPPRLDELLPSATRRQAFLVYAVQLVLILLMLAFLWPEATGVRSAGRPPSGTAAALWWVGFGAAAAWFASRFWPSAMWRNRTDALYDIAVAASWSLMVYIWILASPATAAEVLFLLLMPMAVGLVAGLVVIARLRRDRRRTAVDAAWMQALMTKTVVFDRLARRQCLRCGHDLESSSSCRCPWCRTTNYCFTDRHDAIAPAVVHGAVLT